MATVYEQRKYTESDAAKKLREQMEAQQGLKPQDYTSKWQPQIDTTVNTILNRKPFQYDVNGDALYQQYKDRYVDLGRKAMMDTMGQAAQLTGGYGNSAAQMVGQQAYQSYLQGLTDKIPELAQMALQNYNQQGQNLYQQYGLLSGEDQRGYDQWLGAYNRWLAERDYSTGRYDTERGYDYGQFRDTVGDDQWKAQFDEDVRRFDYANSLGEFAPVASSGGSVGYYYAGSPNPNPNPNPDTDPEVDAYAIVKDRVENGGYNSAQMLQAIKTAPITTQQQNALISQYQKPLQTQEVTASSEKRKNNNSAYWSSR